MKEKKNLLSLLKPRHTIFNRMFVFFMLMIFFYNLQAQEKPPHPFTVTIQAASSLAFGTLYQTGASGTVNLTAAGARTSTGTVYLTNQGTSAAPAIFLVTANNGTLLTIMNGPDITLTGSNGGSISLHLGATDVGSPFITTATAPAQTQFRIGGTLTIGSTAANPPGSYSGSFSVTLVQN